VGFLEKKGGAGGISAAVKLQASVSRSKPAQQRSSISRRCVIGGGVALLSVLVPHGTGEPREGGFYRLP